MATITPTTTVNATTMSANWTKGVAGASAKWLAKYLAPKALFNANPTASQASWIAGVQAAAAANSYANGLTNVNLTTVANNATNFGAANYAASGTNKAANYAAVTAPLASAISAVRATVVAMPNTTLQDRINRMTAWATGMAAYKGTF
jgi:hypothetical protein